MEFLTAWGENLPMLLSGLRYSLLIAAVSIVAGYPLGLGLAAMVASRNRLVRAIALVIVESGRGAPALVILYLVYFGLPKFGLAIASVPAACIGLTWNAAAYASEMIRAGLQSVPRGQLEAAHALGLTRSATFGRVILPQGLRSAIPGLMGLAIQMFQGTSLAYGIAVPELMKQAYSIGAESFEYLRTFVLAGLVYAAISVPATWLTVWLERRLSKQY